VNKNIFSGGNYERAEFNPTLARKSRVVSHTARLKPRSTFTRFYLDKEDTLVSNVTSRSRNSKAKSIFSLSRWSNESIFSLSRWSNESIFSLSRWSNESIFSLSRLSRESIFSSIRLISTRSSLISGATTSCNACFTCSYTFGINVTSVATTELTQNFPHQFRIIDRVYSVTKTKEFVNPAPVRAPVRKRMMSEKQKTCSEPAEGRENNEK